jgi:RNA 2',3'-cyclic 3'-phosphodiesterase
VSGNDGFKYFWFMKRLFLAVPLHESAALMTLLEGLQRRLGHERISWVNPVNMHLTLKFLGETSPARVPEIIAAMEKCLSEHTSFVLDFDRTGIFGSRYDPRVLWLGCSQPPDALTRLAQDVLDAFDGIGFLRDRQNFVPHLTLGRIKGLKDKRLFQEVVQKIPQQRYLFEEVRRVVLYESILRKEGPLYKVEQAFDLKPLIKA